MRTLVTSIKLTPTMMTTVGKKLSLALLISSILYLSPLLIKNQLITGSLVNATLIISLLYLGPSEALIMAMLPSLVALSAGTLPLSLAPVIPYIMLSNALYIFIFSKIYQRHFWLAGIIAACSKFAFLYLTSHFLLAQLLQAAILDKVLVMMSWPQLITALIGSYLASLIFVKFKKTDLTPKQKN